MLKVDVVSNIPTPYNQAFFGALSRLTDLRVLYEGPAQSIRPWKESFVEGHESIVHSGAPLGTWGVWDPRLPRSLRGDADVLILSGSYCSPTVAALLRRRPSGPTRMFWGERFRSATLTAQIIRRQLFRRVDCMLAGGERAASQYRTVTKAAVHVLPYSCATTNDRPRPCATRMGFVGQLIERKGLDLLLEACLAGEPPGLDVIGSGPLEDGLRRRAAASDLDVAWYGEQPNGALVEMRSKWAFQVVPSRYDGWGVVVNEALASGTPAIVSSSVGAEELIRDDVNGWHHEGGSVSALATALARAQEGSRRPEVRRAATITGSLFASDRAAAFLVEVMESPAVERSFIAEQWKKAETLLGNR